MGQFNEAHMTEDQTRHGPTAPSRSSTLLASIPRAIFGDEYYVGRGFLTATIFAWFIELLYGLSAEQQVLSGLRTFCLLWFASGAAFMAGTIGGFLFGVPKMASTPANFASTNPASTPPILKVSRYTINTNLEDISDWFTKIILGLGLVHVNNVIQFIDSVGAAAGSAIGPAQGAKVVAISAMIYGFVCGFLLVYLWTRTSLRRELEKAEHEGETG
jgi:hypothetical protein